MESGLLPGHNLLAIATLLKEARRIERDLAGRLSKHPQQKSLRKQHNEYKQLVGRLTSEFKDALVSFLETIGPAAVSGTTTRRSARAAASRPRGKRPSPR